ncbi:MAG: hypothetical protein OXU23_03710 [Candidatus Poribacteria bacterium]|nr:hypothetical protein [Candidatus Poribacteria bacterium]
MTPKEMKDQARLALLDLENAVLRVLAKRQSIGPLNLKTRYISEELGFTTPTEIQIVKCILNNLKQDGCVETFDSHGDAWQIPR